MAYPDTLVLAPTRELASQIHDEASRFTFDSKPEVRCLVCYGGSDIRMQIMALQRGCDILVATPGRLCDLVSRGRIVSLSEVNYLVLDEADRMLDMGFEPQIREIVLDYGMPLEASEENIADKRTRVRQTALFSATFPKQIQRLAADFMGDYIFVTVGRVGSTTTSIEQRFVWSEENQKRENLIRALGQVSGLTLVFVEKKRTADDLHYHLYHAEGISATSIHGDRSQREREEALFHFTQGNCPVLVATDVASRGLDIPNVTHVINYDMPSEIDSYVHRIGRTGRAGNKGVATSFMNESNMNLSTELVNILEETLTDIPSWLKSLAAAKASGLGGRRGGSRFGGRDARRSGGRNGGGGGGRGRSGGGGGRGRGRGGGRGGGRRSGGRRGGRSNRGGGGGGSRSQPRSTDAW